MNFTFAQWLRIAYVVVWAAFLGLNFFMLIHTFTILNLFFFILSIGIMYVEVRNLINAFKS
jgi:hypothetical protein